MRVLDRVAAAVRRWLDRLLEGAVTPVYPAGKIFDEPTACRRYDLH